MPGFYSDLAHDPVYQSLPARIDEIDLERRVAALRLGDKSQAKPIVISLMRLAMSLVANFAHKRRNPDLIGIALLTLVETVDVAAERLVDNNIIPFVSTHINLTLKNEIAKDHVVCIPPRRLREFRQRGIDAFVPITLIPTLLEGVARPEEPSTECLEMLDKIIRSDRERLLLTMRAERHNLTTIANAIGVSTALIHKLKSELRDRYLALNAEADK